MATRPQDPSRALLTTTRAESLTLSARTGRRGLAAEARELWSYRHLIKVLMLRELRIRYKNSVLGIAWSLVTPLVQVFVLTIAIGYILNSGPANLGVYILCAYLPWTFFQTSVLDASSSVISQIGMLKKVYFPREIFVIAAVCSNLVHFGISLLIFLVYRWGYVTLMFGWPGWPPREVLWLPALVLIEVMLTLGVSFFVAAWNVFYEDVKFIVTTLLSFLFYMVPIIYFAENIVYSGRIPKHWRWWIYHLYLANPLAWLVTAYKQIFFTPQIISNRDAAPVMSAPFDYRYFAITFVVSLGICLAGYSHFNARKWKFTERP